MDQELVAFLNRHFSELREETSEKIDGLRGEMSEKIDGLRGEVDGLREETRTESRQTQVMIEGLRSDLQVLAEGIMANDEKAQVRHAELILEIDKVKVSIAPYYQNLDKRMGRLEEWADRQGEDAMQLIREKFGKR
jgi:hypothetical protein